MEGLSIFETLTSGFTAAAKAQLAGLTRVGQVTTATSVTVFEATDLIGQGDDAFAGWYVYVLQSDNAAPENETKPMSDYVSSTGKVTHTSATVFEATDLIGQGDDAFAGWYVYVLQSDNAAPENETQPMSDYVSSTGKVTHTALTAQLAVGDWVTLLHPSIAMLGAVDTSAATGAVTSTDFLMAYVKQLVNIYQLADPDLDPSVLDVSDYDDNLHSLEALRAAIDALTAPLISTSVGVAQIAATTIDLDQAASSYDLFTGTSQAVVLESLSFKTATGAAGGALTSISIQTDDATPGVIINSTDGVVGNLTSEADLSWVGALYITVATKIQLTIAGGAHGSAYVCQVTATYRSVVAGGALA